MRTSLLHVQHFVGASAARLRPGALYHSHRSHENRQEGVTSRIQLSLDHQKAGRAYMELGIATLGIR
jgi:hypothetical protein